MFVAAGVIAIFAAFGQSIIELLGISIQALQVAGGLLLVLVALGSCGRRAEVARTGARGNVALVPLGTPLLAGPGTIATAMLYMRRASSAGDVASVVIAPDGSAAGRIDCDASRASWQDGSGRVSTKEESSEAEVAER